MSLSLAIFGVPGLLDEEDDMNRFSVYGFVDGNYLRRRSLEYFSGRFVNPRLVVERAVKHYARLQDGSKLRLLRVLYYDAMPQGQQPETNLERYWKKIESLDDTHLCFGLVKASGISGREPKQKAVDTLLSVDMLVGAFDRAYSIAVLVAGDADYVPAVREVQRRGCTVVVIAHDRSLSKELKSAADRVVLIPENSKEGNNSILVELEIDPKL